MDAQKYVLEEVKTTFIYFLKDPENPNKGYVGKTGRLKERLPEHLYECRTEKHYRANWINSLVSRGLSPTLEVIDEVPFEHWKQLEVAYIEFFLEQGYKLTNGTPGGEDPPSTAGKPMPPEIRKKIGDAQRGEKNHRFGKKNSPEQIAAVAKKNTGKKRSPEFCAKIGDKHRGKKATPGFIKKLSTAHTGIKLARNKSGFVGVCGDRGRWKTHFKKIQLGAFKKIEDAVFVRALYAAIYSPA